MGKNETELKARIAAYDADWKAHKLPSDRYLGMMEAWALDHARRLDEALARTVPLIANVSRADFISAHGMNGEQIERMLEYVVQARDGLITAGEMAAKIETMLGAKFEREVA